MKQITILSAACGMLLSLHVQAQPAGFDAATHSEMFKKMMECHSWSEAKCRDACGVASRSFSDVVTGDASAIAECRTLYAAAEGGGRPAVHTAQDLTAIRQEIRRLADSCRGHGRGSENYLACVRSCREASQNPADSALVERCRTLQPEPSAPPPSLSAEDMEKMAVYCESVRDQIPYRGRVHPADSCASTCRLPSQDALTGPARQQSCAGLYQAVRKMAGN